MQACVSQKKDAYPYSRQPPHTIIDAEYQGEQHSEDRNVKHHERGNRNFLGQRPEYRHDSPFVIGYRVQLVREKSRES